jgi:hypothetical protein
MLDVHVMNLEQQHIMIFNLFITILTLFHIHYSSSAESNYICVHDVYSSYKVKKLALNSYSVVDRPPKHLENNYGRYLENTQRSGGIDTKS